MTLSLDAQHFEQRKAVNNLLREPVGISPCSPHTQPAAWILLAGLVGDHREDVRPRYPIPRFRIVIDHARP